MANIAIEIRVGNHPDHWLAGVRWYFSDGHENSKISSETLKEIVSTAIETELTKRGIIKDGLIYPPA